MYCKWFLYRSKNTEEKRSQVICGKGFVASVCAVHQLTVTLWKMSLQCHVIGVFQPGAWNLGMVTFQSSGSSPVMRRVAKYPGHLSAQNILGCCTVHRGRVSDFSILIFAI